MRQIVQLTARAQVAAGEVSGFCFTGFAGFFDFSPPGAEFTLLIKSALLTPPVIRSLWILRL